MAKETGVAEAGQRLPLLNTQNVAFPKPHGAKKLLWDVMLAVILALIAAVAVDMLLHAAPDHARHPSGCDAAFSDAGFSGTMFRCDDAAVMRRDVRI